MKKLLLILGLATLKLKAQTVAIRITVDTTNVFNITAPARHIQGLQLAWQRDILMANQLTNTPPTWPQSVTNEILSRLKSLTDQAIADEIQTNKLSAAASQLLNIWPQLSATQQSNLVSILKPFVQ